MLLVNACCLIGCSMYIQDLESCRQVAFDEVMEYCRSIRCPLVETSAKVKKVQLMLITIRSWEVNLQIEKNHES